MPGGSREIVLGCILNSLCKSFVPSSIRWSVGRPLKGDQQMTNAMLTLTLARPYFKLKILSLKPLFLGTLGHIPKIIIISDIDILRQFRALNFRFS